MDNKSCFVIMPFSATSDKHDEKYWDNFFEIIRSEMELKQFNCKRSETGPHNMLKQIIENISDCDFLIAVLTDKNPNVWYELGIRHSLRNGTLMLIESGQPIPFDVSAYGLVKYQDDISLATKLRKEISSYLDKLSSNKHYDSPVLDLLGLPIRHKEKIDEMYELILRISNEKSDKKYEKDEATCKRILWVDDYPSNNEQVIIFFQRMGVKFDLAINTDQGMRLFNENEYDLVITDMGRGRQPDAGLHLIQQIIELKKNIPPVVVFASQQAIINYGNQAIEYGASATLNGISEVISFILRTVFEEKDVKANAIASFSI
jgi:CheY-like chemotaxis protein